MEDDVEKPVTIFLPSRCAQMSANTSSLLLLGYASNEKRTICITNHRVFDASSNVLVKSNDIYPMGILINEGNEPAIYNSKSSAEQMDLEHGFTLQRRNGPDKMYCTIHKILQTEMNVSSVIVIYYDLDILMKSCYFLYQNNDSSWCADLVKCLKKTNALLHELDLKAVSLDQRISNVIYRGLYQIAVRLPKELLSWFLYSGVSSTWGARAVGNMSSLCVQIRKKHTELAALDSEALKHNTLQFLRLKNTLWRNGLDVLLGVLLMLWLMQDGRTLLIASHSMSWADTVGSELKRLLHWMMGVPAGLKLNSQLDQFLGNFFLYHIYLWTGYLSMLKPVLGTVLWYISLSGCLGLSIQIALLQDLISSMTLHIYCFYVYAARLYSWQVRALTSLWRLFRGKKWNVLRSRVDSMQYDVDQLFIGTLLFTILLFLLPTTALYYVVFTALRLVVLLVQAGLSGMVSVINRLPVYFLFASLFTPASLADEPQFSIHPSVQHGPTVTHFRSFKLKRRCWSKLLQDAVMPPLQQERAAAQQTSFLSKLISGQLIYPWLEFK